jgi:acetyl-CoA acetyltransferase
MRGPLYGTSAAAGVGMLQYKRGTAPYGEREILIRAIVAACEEAGLDPADVDGFVSYGDDRYNEPPRLMPALGTKELKLSTQIWGGGGGGLLAAFELAAMAIATGQAQAVIVFRTLVEGNTGRLSTAVTEHHVNNHYGASGVVSIASLFAIRARRMIKQHPCLPAVVEAMLRADYHHASKNPEALAYGNSFDLDTYRKSRWIAEPLHLFDCSRESDGAGAVLMVSAERARDLRKMPVYLLGAAQGAPKGWGDLLENDTDFSQNGFAPVVRRLWQSTGPCETCTVHSTTSSAIFATEVP